MEDREDFPLDTRRKRETRIAEAKDRSIVPLLEHIAAEFERREKTGELQRDLKKQKVGSLIHNLTKILASIKANSPVVVMPQPAASDGKSPEWFRANSANGMTDRERALQRNKILNAEVVDENPPPA